MDALPQRTNKTLITPPTSLLFFTVLVESTVELGCMFWSESFVYEIWTISVWNPCLNDKSWWWLNISRKNSLSHTFICVYITLSLIKKLSSFVCRIGVKGFENSIQTIKYWTRRPICYKVHKNYFACCE